MKKPIVSRSILLHSGIAAALALSVFQARAITNTWGKSFPSPQAAMTAFSEAVQTTNRAALWEIFGAEAGDLVNRDPVQAASDFAAFAAALKEECRLVRQSGQVYLVAVGKDAYHFPVPLVEHGGGWAFDTAAGKQELLNRHIGRNELATLQTMRAYVDAQREYASQARDGSQVCKYAQRLVSSPGKKDGLYWSPELDGEISPLGPLVACAQAEGYGKNVGIPGAQPEPFHGYHYKVLTRQGRHAPGGRYDYVINGNMIGGFALLAWPSDYGRSGVMSFIVNQQGRVFQKDLGSKTASVAARMKAYDPEPTWELSKD